MRILFDHQIFGWQQYGGISRYICELARALALDPAQQVRIIAPLCVNRHLLEAAGKISVTGRRVPRLPGGGRFYRHINALLAAPLATAFAPDIVHETFYAASRQAPQGARVVLTVHDMIHERFLLQHSRLDPTRWEKARAIGRADHVICVSEHTRHDLLELLDVDPAKISVVYHGFAPLPAPSIAAGSTERPFLLYVGQRGRYKNFDGLLRAYAASPRLRQEFDLVCFGGPPLSSAERRRVHALGLREGSVQQQSGSDRLLAGHYRAASALIYPSLYEGFGIPPLEAMSLDCPVACSAVSSIPEVVGNAAALFDPHEVESIREAVERLVGDAALRQVLIRRGRQRVKAFSWARCAEQTLGVYRRVLD